MRIIFCLAFAACGGGSSKKPERYPEVKEPAWAEGYVQRADEGCACSDAACLGKAHGELAAIEKSHGGIDDAPPSVHVAHGKFDRCWREGTRDISRDFEFTAQAVCTCATSDCLRTAKIELAGLVDGKYRENLDAELQANPRAAAAAKRAADCIVKATMPAAEALAAFDRLGNAMCACTDFNCASAVMGDRTKAMGNYLAIDPAIDASHVTAFVTKFCGCLEKAAAEAIKNMTPFPAMTSVNVNLNCR